MKKINLVVLIMMSLPAITLADVLVLKDNTYLPNIVVLKSYQGRLTFRLDKKNYSLSEKHIQAVATKPPSDAEPIGLDELRTYIKNEKEKDKQQAEQKIEVQAQLDPPKESILSKEQVSEPKAIQVAVLPSIRIKGSVFWNWDYTYYIDNEQTHFQKFDQTLQRVPQAHRKFKDSKSLHPLAVILGATSGFCVGWSLGPALRNEPINIQLLVVGSIGLILDGLLSSTIDQGVKQAVDSYNQQKYSEQQSRRNPWGPSTIKANLVQLAF